MAKSDLDDPVNSASDYSRWKMTRGMDDKARDSDKEMHSGHFMVSSLVDNEGDNEVGEESEKEEEPKGYDFTTANKDTNQSYKFGNRSTMQLAIDASLTKLFDCMTLAYSGKLTSPKWKNFKGIKVPLKDKIRLNNIIWREWHMQYIQGNLPIICQFEPPISEKIHIKAEAVVLEGKYWKRRLESVTAEYKKWRMFWRDRSKKESRDDTFMETMMHMDRIETRRRSTASRISTPQMITPPLEHQYMTDEDFYMDFTDTLFSSLNQPFNFPNPREICQLGNADIIQPGLMQLQPTLDEFMDTLEPLPSLNEMMGISGRPNISPLLSVPCTMPRQLPLPMETSSLSFSGTNQTYPSNSNAQISIAQPPQVIAEPQTVTLCDFQNQPIAAKPQQVTLRDFQNQPIAAKPRQVTLSDLQGQPIIVQHQQVNLGDLQNQPMTAQPQQLTLVDLQNQNRTHMQEQLNRERVRNLSGDALVQAELNSATSQINALLGNSTVGDVTIGNTTIGNSGIGNASIISDLDQNKLFSNTAPQIINLVLNPGVTSNIMVSTATETTPQQPTVIKPTNTQYDLQLPVRPTVQQLLNQHQKQNQSTPPSNKTVTIIQNTSLQALLQGLGQTQASVTVTQASGMPLATVLQNLGQTQSPTSVTRSTGAPLATVLETTVPPVGQNMKREPVMFDLGGSLSDNKPSVFPAAPSQSTAQHSIKQSRNRSEGTIQSMLSSIRSQTLADSRRRSAGSSDSNIFGTRKDGDFLVPSTTVVPKLRPRSLAPAPPSGSNAPVTVSNNVLAQLLTQGQGQGLPLLGGGMGIKQEEAFGNLSAFKPIQPAPVSLNKTSCITTNTPTMATASDFTVTATNVSDFQRNLLLAAVNQAIGSGTVQFPELTTNSTASPIASLSDPSSPPYNPNSPQFILPSPGSPTSELGSRSRHASNDSTGSASGYRDTDFDFQNALKPFRPKNEVERAQYKEMRRASHINAEQKRRGNIKVGFEMLHQLVPALRMTPSSKSSIANTLGKSADYCRKLKQERGQMQDEAEILRQEIDSLNNSISLCQSQLPATGVPVTRQRADQMREKFDNYVRGRTLQNWKFWIFSIIIQNLLDSYNKTVSTSSIEELCRTVLAWLEQHCSLVALRPTVLNSLRQLCTTTSILSDPSKVPQQATQAVQNPGDLSTNMGSSS